MNITWYGQSCFRVALQGQKKAKQWTSLVIDPFDESTGLKLPKLEAEIFLITHEHKDHNNQKIATKETFLINSPGEYELRDIFIQGISSFHDKEKGKERGLNTIYTVETEEVKLCHLGDFGQEELTDEQLRDIGEVDVLMIPVGGVYTIDAKEATKVISQIEPRIVIPMHYKIPGLKVKLDELGAFLKAIGDKGAKAEDKISIQKKNLPVGEMKIIPLNPQSKNSTK
jgi:L-ascorbate metabolism protein UlaG (beta-lactamase superfamily)